MVWNHLSGSPVTRIYSLVSLGIGLLTLSEVFEECDIFYSPKMIFQHQQYWRIFSSLFYFGELSPKMILHLTSFVQYSATLESNVFTGRPADFIIFWTFGLSFFYAFGNLLSIAFLSECLVSYALYYWSKHFPDQQVTMFSLPFPLKVQYMPVVCLAMTYMMKGRMALFHDLFGFMVSHTFFFLRDVVSAHYNVTLMKAPEWLEKATIPLKSN